MYSAIVSKCFSQFSVVLIASPLCKRPIGFGERYLSVILLVPDKFIVLFHRCPKLVYSNMLFLGTDIKLSIPHISSIVFLKIQWSHYSLVFYFPIPISVFTSALENLFSTWLEQKILGRQILFTFPLSMYPRNTSCYYYFAGQKLVAEGE